MGKIVGLTFDEPSAMVCPRCGKTYKTPEALAKHIKEKHPDAANGSGVPPAGSAPGQE